MSGSVNRLALQGETKAYQLEEPTDLVRHLLRSRLPAAAEGDRADGGAIVLGTESESFAEGASDPLKLGAQRVLRLQAVLPWRVSRCAVRPRATLIQLSSRQYKLYAGRRWTRLTELELDVGCSQTRSTRRLLRKRLLKRRAPCSFCSSTILQVTRARPDSLSSLKTLVKTKRGRGQRAASKERSV